MENKFAIALMTPVKALRARYVPLLMIYFAQGASGLSAIAQNFWIKEELGLSAEALVAIGIWLTIPWTIKMVFGQFVDCIPILGSRRKIYVFIGAGFMALATLMLAGTAGGWLKLASPEALYIAASLFAVVGLVIQDVVADTMSTEVASRVDQDGKPLSEEIINQELGTIQVLGRLSLVIGAFSVAGLGGWLANVTSFQNVFLIAVIIPFISVIGTIFMNVEAMDSSDVDWRILGGGLAFGAATMLIGILNVPFGQEFIFILSIVVIFTLIRLTVVELSTETRRTIFFAAVIIFVFRAMPGIGPGGQWWQIDVLEFDPAFFGILAQIGTGLAIAGTWMFGGFISRTPFTTILLGLTVISAVMTLPNIALYYGLHEWTNANFGFGARTIAILDSSLESPFAQLSMIPLLTLIAIHAPPGKRATWFALMASLMNLALNAGGLATKYLNKVFIIERGEYGELSLLLITVTLIGLAVPVLTIIMFGDKAINSSKSNSEPVVRIDKK